MIKAKKKISEIAKDIWENHLTEEEKEKNNSNVMTKRLNTLLVENGDLMEGPYGKQETHQGLDNGIEGELIVQEDLSRFWLPMYTEKGYQHVLSLFEEHRDEIVEVSTTIEAVETPPEPVRYRYSRRVWREMKEKYKDFQIIAMEEENRYWIFDEDAELLAMLFRLQVNEVRRGKNIIVSKENNIERSVFNKLNDAGIPYVIVHPLDEETFNSVETQNTTRIMIDQRPIVGLGRVFEMREENGEINRYIILEEGDHNEMRTVTRADGTEDIISVPRYDDINGVTRISPRTPLARMLINSHEGDTVTHNGEKFTITNLIEAV